MAKLSAIYGADDNDFAQGIAADALRNTAPPQITIDNSAMSHGTSKGTTTDTNPVKVISDKGDSRATVKGNHGEQG